MNIVFVADGRSPTAINWISYFVDQGHGVHLVSMYACQPDLELDSLTVIPAAFSGAAELGSQQPVSGSRGGSMMGRILRGLATPRMRTWLRHRFVPPSLPLAAERLADLISSLQPELVHALRIPYEGMLAALAYDSIAEIRPPLMVSVWGNDFSLHAPTTRGMKALTRKTLDVADALHTDCVKDQSLAYGWGFDPKKPAIVLPGGGGIQLETFFAGEGSREMVVINPRGLRSYVQNDTFFQAIPIVLAQRPDTRFLCPAMQGQPEAERWVQKLDVGKAVDLLPLQARDQMATLYRQAQVVVSPSTHDGTPNTLLEAMACGCIPVAGDIDSLREWITPGVNGLLVDPTDPTALADGILEALGKGEFETRARKYNQELIRERATYGTVMLKATAFYIDLMLEPDAT